MGSGGEECSWKATPPGMLLQLSAYTVAYTVISVTGTGSGDVGADAGGGGGVGFVPGCSVGGC